LFHTDSGYQQLDERKPLTLVKISELLYILEHPELPLHNNPAELAARTMVQRGNISYATQTLKPTFGTLCHRDKLPRGKLQGSIKTNICSEKRHWRNSKAPEIASKAILNKE
jgi:hypothetical protein